MSYYVLFLLVRFVKLDHLTTEKQRIFILPVIMLGLRRNEER